MENVCYQCLLTGRVVCQLSSFQILIKPSPVRLIIFFVEVLKQSWAKGISQQAQISVDDKT